VSSFRDDGALALDWVASYLERVGEFPVLARVEPGRIRALLPQRAPEQPEPFEAVLRDLDEVLLPGLTHWQSPRYFAYFATTGSEPGVLAELLIAGLNQVGILWRTSPALQELEELTLDWLRQLVDLPEEFAGHIEDTASTGVVAALAVARMLRPDRRVVVCSEHAHSAADKAARLLELELRKVPVDDAYRLRADALELAEACAVVATIGTTADDGNAADGPPTARDSIDKTVEKVAGTSLADLLTGSRNDDVLVGLAGNDRLKGLAGADIFKGKGGIDILLARDGQADKKLNCGPGANSRERAKLDLGLDPTPKSC